MKNKLWTYGCSFTYDAHWPRYDKGWFDYIADEFELEHIARHSAGYGWTKIKNDFYEDLPKWGENDMIIVQSSHLLRMYCEFLQLRFDRFRYNPEVNCIREINDEKNLEALLYISKSIPEIKQENWNQFRTSLEILERLNKRWYWWVFEFNGPEGEPGWECNDDILKKFGDKFLNFDCTSGTFDEYMYNNPHYCKNYEIGDMHQTYECHKIQGDVFINKIKDYEKRRTNSSL